MWFQNKLDRIAPNLANAGSAISRKIKGRHPVKSFWAFMQRMQRKVSKIAVTVRVKSNELGTTLPRIPLSFRTAAEADAVNIMVGGEFNARSKDGLVLGAKDNPDQWKGVDGVDVETVKMKLNLPTEEAKRDYRNEATEDREVEAVVLKGVSKKALKARSIRMKKANKKFHRQHGKYLKAMVQGKTSAEIDKLFQNMQESQVEKLEADASYSALRRIATRLKTKELGEKYGNEYAIRVIEGIKTKALAFEPESFDTAITDITGRLAEGWKLQAALDAEIDQISREVQAWVYEDVAEYLDTDPRFATLVDAKSKHQLISGTEKLQFATQGHIGRWPGLDYYVEAAKDKYQTFTKPNSQIVKALEMMKADMDMMMPNMVAQMNAIRQDDPDNQGKGWFNARRLSDYYNLKAWMRTHMEVTQMLDDPSEEGISNMVSSFGESLGFEFGRTPEEVENHRRAIVEKYGFSPDEKLVTVTEGMIASNTPLPEPIPRPVTRSGEETETVDEQQSLIDVTGPQKDITSSDHSGMNNLLELDVTAPTPQQDIPAAYEPTASPEPSMSTGMLEPEVLKTHEQQEVPPEQVGPKSVNDMSVEEMLTWASSTTTPKNNGENNT